jgi:hypothetical protein
VRGVGVVDAVPVEHLAENWCVERRLEDLWDPLTSLEERSSEEW